MSRCGFMTEEKAFPLFRIRILKMGSAKRDLRHEGVRRTLTGHMKRKHLSSFRHPTNKQIIDEKVPGFSLQFSLRMYADKMQTQKLQCWSVLCILCPFSFTKFHPIPKA